jgi:hypothetical protein
MQLCSVTSAQNEPKTSMKGGVDADDHPLPRHRPGQCSSEVLQCQLECIYRLTVEPEVDPILRVARVNHFSLPPPPTWVTTTGDLHDRACGFRPAIEISAAIPLRPDLPRGIRSYTGSPIRRLSLGCIASSRRRTYDLITTLSAEAPSVLPSEPPAHRSSR